MHSGLGHEGIDSLSGTTNFQAGVPPGMIGYEHPNFLESVANRDNVAPRRSHTTNPAPWGMGALPDYDRQFAETNADRGALPGDNLPDPAGYWHPLWQEPHVQEHHASHVHKMRMEGYNDLPDLLQHGETFYTYNNHAAPYNLNLEQPTPLARHECKVYSALGM